MFCLPISTFMYLWAIYIFPGSVCLFCCSQIGRPVLGIYKSFTDTWMEELGTRPCSFISGNSVQCGLGYKPVLSKSQKIKIKMLAIQWSLSWLFAMPYRVSRGPTQSCDRRSSLIYNFVHSVTANLLQVPLIWKGWKGYHAQMTLLCPNPSPPPPTPPQNLTQRPFPVMRVISASATGNRNMTHHSPLLTFTGLIPLRTYKKENIIFLIYQEIQKGSVAYMPICLPYMVKYLRAFRKPFLIYDFATDPIWISHIWGEFPFLFYQCGQPSSLAPGHFMLGNTLHTASK